MPSILILEYYLYIYYVLFSYILSNIDLINIPKLNGPFCDSIELNVPFTYNMYSHSNEHFLEHENLF